VATSSFAIWSRRISAPISGCGSDMARIARVICAPNKYDLPTGTHWSRLPSLMKNLRD
jgi:hypothetical protein